MFEAKPSFNAFEQKLSAKWLRGCLRCSTVYHDADSLWASIAATPFSSVTTTQTAIPSRLQPGFEDADTCVQAAVAFYSVYDFTLVEDAMHPSMPELPERTIIKQRHSTNLQSYIDASPVTYVSADAPPFFLPHGRNDSLVPVEEARSFVAKLREVSGQPVVYAELPFTQ